MCSTHNEFPCSTDTLRVSVLWCSAAESSERNVALRLVATRAKRLIYENYQKPGVTWPIIKPTEVLEQVIELLYKNFFQIITFSKKVYRWYYYCLPKI